MRKNNQPLKVYCTLEERAKIINNSKHTYLSVSAYLRNLGLGTKIKSKFDNNVILDLHKINADLARLGNLLNQIIKNKLLNYDLDTYKIDIIKLIRDLKHSQNQLKQLLKKDT